MNPATYLVFVHYYNEIDPYAADWLRNLIAAGHLPEGEVDTRDIWDVRPADLARFTSCHFFAGIGGWPHALRLAGWPDDRPVWTGSCPCQPFSAAGKGRGFADERHLWPAWFWLIVQCRPLVIFGEQVDKALDWLDLVATDLEGEGYQVGAGVLPAASVGALHRRHRLWFVTDPKRNEQSRPEPRSWKVGRMERALQPFPWDEDWQAALARFRAMDDGLPRCVEATDAARNAIVPQVAAEFIQAYLDSVN